MLARYPAAPTSVGMASRDVDMFAQRGGLSELTRELIALAVSEAASNVVLHAYLGTTEPASFDIDAELQRERLVVIVEDRGSGMRAHPDSPGMGLGLGLIGSVARRSRSRTARRACACA